MTFHHNHYLFSSFESFEIDNREEAFQFEVPIPTVLRRLLLQVYYLYIDPYDPYGDDGDNHIVFQTIRIGVTPLSLKFWIQTFFLLCIQSLFNILIALTVYYFIVKPQRHNNTNDKKEHTSSIVSTSQQSYLIGYGIICPFLLIWPFILFQNILEMKNIALMLCLTGAVPNLLLLRVTEAIHRMLPDFCYQSTATAASTKQKQKQLDEDDVNGKVLSSSSSSSYQEEKSPLVMLILYYSATLQFQFDPISHQPIPLTTTILKKKIMKFIAVFVQTSLLYSFLIPFNYQPFTEPSMIGNQQSTIILKLWYFYHPTKLANSFLLASLLSLVLDGTF